MRSEPRGGRPLLAEGEEPTAETLDAKVREIAASIPEMKKEIARLEAKRPDALLRLTPEQVEAFDEELDAKRRRLERDQVALEEVRRRRTALERVEAAAAARESAGTIPGLLDEVHRAEAALRAASGRLAGATAGLSLGYAYAGKLGLAMPGFDPELRAEVKRLTNSELPRPGPRTAPMASGSS